MIAELDALQLETERLTIRAVIQTDLESIYSIHTDQQVNRYLPYQTWLAWADAQAWYTRVQERRGLGTAEQFVIIRNSDGVLVGTCIVFIHEPDGVNLELGYVLARPHWGKGYMFEALSEFIPSIAKRLSLTSLLALIQTENSSSIKLIRKLGFHQPHRKQGDANEAIYFSLEFDKAALQ